MRITMNLPDGLMVQATARAAATGRTLTGLVEEGLRMVLQADPSTEPPEPLPEYGDSSGRFLVDVEDRDALWAALDADKSR